VTYPNPPSPAKNTECAPAKRAKPGPPCLSLSYFSLVIDIIDIPFHNGRNLGCFPCIFDIGSHQTKRKYEMFKLFMYGVLRGLIDLTVRKTIPLSYFPVPRMTKQKETKSFSTLTETQI
jgi:hypothetical protein